MNVLTEIFQWMKEKKLKFSFKKGEDFREMKGDFIIMKVEEALPSQLSPGMWLQKLEKTLKVNSGEIKFY